MEKSVTQMAYTAIQDFSIYHSFLSANKFVLCAPSSHSWCYKLLTEHTNYIKHVWIFALKLL